MGDVGDLAIKLTNLLERENNAQLTDLLASLDVGCLANLSQQHLVAGDDSLIVVDHFHDAIERIGAVEVGFYGRES